MTERSERGTVPPAAEIEKPEDPDTLHEARPDPDATATVEDYHPDDLDPEAVVDEAAPGEDWDEEDWVEPGAPEEVDQEEVGQDEGQSGGPE